MSRRRESGREGQGPRGARRSSRPSLPLGPQARVTWKPGCPGPGPSRRRAGPTQPRCHPPQRAPLGDHGESAATRRDSISRGSTAPWSEIDATATRRPTRRTPEMIRAGLPVGNPARRELMGRRDREDHVASGISRPTDRSRPWPYLYLCRTGPSTPQRGHLEDREFPRGKLPHHGGRALLSVTSPS